MKTLESVLLGNTKFLLIIGLTVLLGACDGNLGKDELSPAHKSKSGARTGSVDCSVYNSSNVSSAQRDRAVAQYGSDGGNYYDMVKNYGNPSNSYTYIYNYSSSLRNYITQLESGVKIAAQQYMNEVQSSGNFYGPGYNYVTFAFRNHIVNALYGVKDQAMNDASLDQQSKDIIANVVTTAIYNFDYASPLIEDQLDDDGNANCFPNPSWYNSGYGGNSYKFGVGTNSFFSSVLKAIAKVVNIVATIIVDVVEQAGQFALYGALGGSLGGQTLPGLAVGAVIGGVVGIAVGINDCIAGNYVCIFAPCS